LIKKSVTKDTTPKTRLRKDCLAYHTIIHLYHKKMTKFNSLLIGFSVFIVTLSACKNDPKTTTESNPAATQQRYETPSTEGAVTFTITEGLINWVGTRVGGQHNGTLKIKGGELKVNQGRILSGTINIDMTSLTVLDLKDPKEKAELEEHLKDDDFFNAGKFPEGVFTVEEMLPSTLPAFNAVITGVLELKGKKSPVNIPVNIKITDNDLSAESAAFIINRTNWGINYSSGIIGTVKDKLINDNVSLALTLKAQKK